MSGCAERLILQPVVYETLSRPEALRTLTAEGKGEPATGSAHPLPAGMRLQPVGRIPQGLVLRPVGREIVIMGEDREECYIVVQGTSWIGYYLPFERAYLALKQPVPLSLE